MSDKARIANPSPADEMASTLADAVAHHQAGRLDLAEQGYFALLRMDTDHPDALHLLGVLANEAGNHTRAVALIRRSLVMMPDFPDAHLNLGNALNGLGDTDGARAAFERAIALRPDFLLARLNLADLLNRRGAPVDAETHARNALRLAPGLERARLALWQALRAQQRFSEAIQVMQQTLGARPGVPALLCDLGATLADAGELETALTLHRQAIAMEPGNFLLHMGHATSLNLAGDINGAIPVLHRVLELNDTYIPAWLTLGWCQRGAGRFEEARACFTRVLQIDPNQSEAHWNLSVLGPAPVADPAQEASLRQLMTRAGVDVFHRAAAGFALGKMLDDQDRCDAAFAVFEQANRIVHESQASRGQRFDPAGFTADIDAIIAHHSEAGLAARSGAGVASELPVFIVGMPRSGTTLVEQIAASHSRVHGAGERRDIFVLARSLAPRLQAAGPNAGWDTSITREAAQAHIDRLTRLGGGAARVIDKTPDNVLTLGLIATLFPGARVIICARDPRDVCLSNFFQLYTDGNAFSYDLGECGWRARETARLMAHWRQVLPVRMLDMQYETLVADLEGQARRLIAFLGLEWEPACVDFHQNDRAITTPNMWGVRQPIYDRRVGRWRSYETHLGPMFSALDGKRPG